jgi:hypothetical protein
MVCEIDKSVKSQDDPVRGTFIVQTSIEGGAKVVVEILL